MKSYSAQKQGRRNAQEDNERRMRELLDEMERERQQALRDAQERARVELEEQREQLDRQRRKREKRERKQKEEERLLQLRLELLNYDFHKCPRIKKEAFQDLEVDDIDLIRIALIGPTGSGKTSLVGKNGCFYLFFYLSFYLSICLQIYSLYPSADHKTICVCIPWLLRLRVFLFFTTGGRICDIVYELIYTWRKT